MFLTVYTICRDFGEQGDFHSNLTYHDFLRKASISMDLYHFIVS
jgi:hypothetical protein